MPWWARCILPAWGLTTHLQIRRCWWSSWQSPTGCQGFHSISTQPTNRTNTSPTKIANSGHRGEIFKYWFGWVFRSWDWRPGLETGRFYPLHEPRGHAGRMDLETRGRWEWWWQWTYPSRADSNCSLSIDRWSWSSYYRPYQPPSKLPMSTSRCLSSSSSRTRSRPLAPRGWRRGIRLENPMGVWQCLYANTP